MAILTVFLYAMVVVLALLLIGIVLIQPAKSGGMGAAFGGIGESVFGAKAGSHLTKATVIMTSLFFAMALALAALIGRGCDKEENKILKKAKTQNDPVATAPAAKAPEKAPAKKATAPVTKTPEKAPAKKATAPVTKKATAPVTKKATAPVTKKATAPVTKKATAPAAKTTEKAPAKKAAAPVAKKPAPAAKTPAKAAANKPAPAAKKAEPAKAKAEDKQAPAK